MKSSLQIALENLGYECTNYSGRSMYDKRCLAIDLDSGTSAFAVGMQVGEYIANHELEISERFNIQELDNLGRDFVMYWPRVEYSEEEESSDIDEDNENDEEE